MASTEDVSAAWEHNARDWLEWSHPDNDVFFWQFLLPAFAEMAPPPGRHTLEVGCGEGRIGRWLAAQGHRVTGIDSAPTLAENARAAGGYEEVVNGDAAALPWSDDEFDGAVAFMVLHDMPPMREAIGEVARVLEVGSPFCVAIGHPLDRAPEQLADYFTEQRYSDEVERNGLRMNFVGINRPLEAYTTALHRAGFVIEELREPRPSADAVARAPELAIATREPFFLYLRCRLT